ncbi:MAG: hypothetical protein ACK4GC_02630 [Paracoccaceae bacterium]
MPETTPEALGPDPSKPRSLLLNLLPTPVIPDFEEWLPAPTDVGLIFRELPDHMPEPYFLEMGVIMMDRERGGAVTICGPLQVTAQIRATDKEPARLRLVVYGEGELKTFTIPAEDLGSASPLGVRMLRRIGLYAPENDRTIAALLRKFRAPMCHAAF